MKKTFQWLSAMALIVMGACISVACSSDSDGGGGTPPDNSKLVGTWVIKSISPDDGHGPSVGDEMTFNANGTFSQGRDQGTYTYDSSSGTFTAKMNSMTMSGSFTMSEDGNVSEGTVKVTANGQTQTYRMTLQKKGSEEDEPAVSSTKMVGTWVVVKDGCPDSAEGMTVVHNEDGTYTLDGEGSFYNCEELEDGRLHFVAYEDDGKTIYSEGWLVLVNNGNVLNGYYQFANQTGENPETYPYVMKKKGYNYPTRGIQGRWQFSYVAQAYGGYDEYFAERLPVQNSGDVFVMGDNGELYVEGDPHVGSYSLNNNQLDLQFAGKYVAKVHGLVEFSGDDIMTIPQGRGTFKESANSGSTFGFQGSIQRVIEADNGGEEDEVVIDERMLGDWTIMTDEGDPDVVGKTITFNQDGTWVIANYQSGKCFTETQDDGRIVFVIKDDEGNQVISGKLVVVSGGNVLTGEYGVGMHAKTRLPDDKDKFGIVLKRPNYTYPSGGIKGRWEMIQCNIPNSPVGTIFVFGEAPELYIEGDPHIDSYRITYTDGKVGGELTMTLDNGPEITGSFIIDGATVTLTGTAAMDGESMPLTATLSRR